MLNIVFKAPEDGYSYSVEQIPLVCIDVVESAGKCLKKINLTVTVTSFDKLVCVSKSITKTFDGIFDTFEFFFDELKEGHYIAVAELFADFKTVTKSIPLNIINSPLSHPADEYNRRISIEGKSIGSFANSFYGENVPTPGIPSSANYRNKQNTDLVLNVTDSAINKDTAAFYFENDCYAYAITKDNKEVIAYKEDGGYIDVLAGGGLFNIKDTENNPAVTATTVSSFKANKNSVNVTYKVISDDKRASAVTHYEFLENSIAVSANVKYNGKNTLKCDSSILVRNFLNEPIDAQTSLNFKWRYPYNNDYPYRYTDCWIIAHSIDKNHRVYSYNHGDIPLRIWNFHAAYPKNDIKTYFAPTSKLDYTLTYDLVLADKRTTLDTDYISLFKGKHSDFAAGISPIIANDDNTSVFVRDSVDLNINITNITKQDTLVSVRYDLRDYYGNILDIGEFLNQNIESKGSINRELNISAAKHGYGMYFINLTVKSKNYTYREYYPFALLNAHEYKYNSTSPYSIGQILPDSWAPFSDSYSIAKKVGIAAVRCAFFANDSGPYHEYLQKFANDGVKILGSGSTEAQIKEYGKHYNQCLYGNEINLASFWGGATVEERFNLYYNNYFKPLRENCDKYGKRLVTAGISAAQTEWFDILYKNGIWDQIDKFSVHVYGIPYSPECPERMDDMWSTEGGLIRTVNALEKYGKKPFQINEMGYHTGRYDSCVCLRTQADYNIRSHVLCAAYGAEFSAAYGLYDFSGSGFGTSMSDNEHHFGHFYMPDCFGRILPKPSGITFAFFTRLMESTKSVTENKELSCGTVKAYTAKTEQHGDVLIAWSNCYRLPNDRGDVENCTYHNTAKREPTMPWQNQWKGCEWVWVNTNNDFVTVVDLMGKKSEYPAHLGLARIPLNGSPICILGAKP